MEKYANKEKENRSRSFSVKKKRRKKNTDKNEEEMKQEVVNEPTECVYTSITSMPLYMSSIRPEASQCAFY